MLGNRSSFVCLVIRPDKMTAIEFAQYGSSFRLKNYSVVKLPANVYNNGEITDEKEFLEAVMNLFKSARPKAITAHNLIVVVENDVVFNHCFVTPKVKQSDALERVIAKEAEGIIPFAQHELYWDFLEQNVPKEDQSDKQKLQYLAIPKSVADKFAQLFKKVNLELLILTGEMEVFKALLKDLPTNVREVVVLRIDYDRTEVLFYEYNVLIRTRTIAFDLKQYVESVAQANKLEPENLMSLLLANVSNDQELKMEHNQEYLQPLVQEISRMLNEYYPDGVLDKIYVWGEGLFVPGLFGMLKTAIKPAPELKVLWKAITIDSKIRTNPQLIQLMNRNITDFGVIVSAAFNFLELLVDYKMLNLLPDSQRVIARNKVINRTLNKMGIVVVILYAVLGGFLFYTFMNFNQRLHVADMEAATYVASIGGQANQELRNDIESFNQQVLTLVQVTNSIEPLPDTLKAIYQLQYDGIVVSNYSYDQADKVIRIEGDASTRQVLLAYQEALNAVLPAVADLDSPLSNFDRSTDVDFQLAIYLDGNPN